MMSMMLAIGLLQAANDPADWTCADPLIEKNYKQEASAFMLAQRIHDECLKPFSAKGTDAAGHKAERSLYMTVSQEFREDIKRRIESRRLRDQVPLNK